MRFDREAPIPLYYQLRTILKDSLENNELKPGDPIPTEKELMGKYAVSRATVRKAIDGLVAEGYLRRERAKGTFVRHPPLESKFLGNLKCFSEEMMKRGIPHSTLVLDKSIDKATDLTKEKLYLEDCDQVFRLKRLRKVENKPILIVESFLPYDLFPGIELIDFNNISLYDLLETKYGIQFHYGKRIIESKTVVSKETIKYLEIAEGTAISYVESTIFDTDNRPIEFLKADMLGRIVININ
jgi:GntR family transcriptional regulator